MRVRKKPVEVQAHQWRKNGDHPKDCVARGRPLWEQEPEGKVVRRFRRVSHSGDSLCGKCGVAFHDHGWIDTDEGGHIVCPGDWIITGVEGERYPCKPSVFEATYEAIP